MKSSMAFTRGNRYMDIKIIFNQMAATLAVVKPKSPEQDKSILV